MGNRGLTKLLPVDQRKMFDKLLLAVIKEKQDEQGSFSMEDWEACGFKYIDGFIHATEWDMEDIDELFKERLSKLARRKVLLATDVGTGMEYVITPKNGE